MGNPSFGTSGVLLLVVLCLLLRLSAWLVTKEGLRWSWKGKREDDEEILQKRVEREIWGEIRAVRNLWGGPICEERGREMSLTVATVYAMREAWAVQWCWWIWLWGGWLVREVREGKSVLLCRERLGRLPIEWATVIAAGGWVRVWVVIVT